MRTIKPHKPTKHYTRFFAYLPRRVTSGQLIWLAPYWITADRNGQGIILNRDEYLRETQYVEH